ncbi:MAG: putative DNA binding domain-containing protein [Prolixibacteraceae bacterium]|nr:putative DNA binding domain-containing protein [Prolixibacteraceae bacterium]
MEHRQLSLFDDAYDHPFIARVFGSFPESESEEIEYKSAKGGFPDEFWKTYSAFANTKGGFIVLGVKEQKNELIFEGLPTNKISTYKKAFWDGANNTQKVSVNLLSNTDLVEVTFEGNHFLAFKIPVATRVQRPVFISTNPFGNTYKRNHEGDYRCTKEEVSRMIADADLNTHADSRILEGFTFDDYDANSIRQYRQLFSSIHITHSWLLLNDKEFLTQLGAYRYDRKSKNEGITLAGMLMFGKTNSIIDPECCPKFFPDYREILSRNPEIRWTDRICPDGNWEANLFQFYRMVWPKLASSLPKPFQLKDGVRQDETPAHIALREAFVNALIHTDYSAQNNIVIEQRIDSYKFSNPGTLLVSIRQYYHGGTSECRNTTLQKMFMMIGSAEKAGSGVSKIMYGWEYAQWRRPYLLVESQPDRIILELPKFSILPEETLISLRELFGNRVDLLGKVELNILAICQIEGEVNNNRLQDSINLHRTDITKILQELCKEGFLISENKSRWTTYHLNTNFANPAESETDSKVDTSEQMVDSSQTLTPNLDTSEQKVDSSNPLSNKTESATKKVDSLQTLTPNLDSYQTLTPKLDTSKQKAKKSAKVNAKKLPKEELYELIINTCKTEYITTEQIALAVKRSPAYLQNEILPYLVNSGKLQRLFPDNPNNPNQAYKAAE